MIHSKVAKHRYTEEITNRLLNDLSEEMISENINLFYKQIESEDDLNSIELLFNKSDIKTEKVIQKNS